MNIGTIGAFKRNGNTRRGAGLGYIFLWLLGIPLPVLLVIFLLRGCH